MNPQIKERGPSSVNHNDKAENRAWNDVAVVGPLLRPASAARYVSLSRSTMYQLIGEGRFPPLIELSKRASGIPISWLDAFIRDRLASSTRSSSGPFRELPTSGKDSRGA